MNWLSLSEETLLRNFRNSFGTTSRIFRNGLRSTVRKFCPKLTQRGVSEEGYGKGGGLGGSGKGEGWGITLSEPPASIAHSVELHRGIQHPTVQSRKERRAEMPDDNEEVLVPSASRRLSMDERYDAYARSCTTEQLQVLPGLLPTNAGITPRIFNELRRRGLVPKPSEDIDRPLVQAMRARGAVIDPEPENTTSIGLIEGLSRMVDEYGLEGVLSTMKDMWPQSWPKAPTQSFAEWVRDPKRSADAAIPSKTRRDDLLDRRSIDDTLEELLQRVETVELACATSPLATITAQRLLGIEAAVRKLQGLPADPRVDVPNPTGAGWW